MLRFCMVGMVLVLVAPVSFAQDAPDIAPFPLEKGSVWVYQGTVAWTLMDGSNEVREDTLTWEMEVIDVIERGDIVGYAMRGHPGDLTWYEEGKEPSEYAIIEVKPGRYYRTELDLLDRLRDDDDLLYELVDDLALFLDLPLASGQRFCPAEQLTRTDYMYCWLVMSVEPADLTGIDGAPPLESPLEYTLIFRTNPDHTIWKFVPGVGITHYVYSHHGTVSEVDVRLIEYHPASSS